MRGLVASGHEPQPHSSFGARLDSISGAYRISSVVVYGLKMRLHYVISNAHNLLSDFCKPFTIKDPPDRMSVPRTQLPARKADPRNICFPVLEPITKWHALSLVYVHVGKRKARLELMKMQSLEKFCGPTDFIHTPQNFISIVETSTVQWEAWEKGRGWWTKDFHSFFFTSQKRRVPYSGVDMSIAPP